MTHPVAIKRIKIAWEKTPFDFALYFVNKPGLGAYAEQGLIKPEQVIAPKPKRGEWGVGLGLSPEDIPRNPDAITVIFVGNSGDERVPMTPWIIAHRFAHAIRREKEYDAFTERVNGMIKRIASAMNMEVEKDSRGWGDRRIDFFSKKSVARNIAQAIGTMRSAREGKLRNYGEFAHELMAQYLIDGEIKFQTPKAISLPGPYGRKDKRHVSDMKRDWIQSITDEYAWELDSVCYDVLSSCVGKVFVM